MCIGIQNILYVKIFFKGKQGEQGLQGERGEDAIIPVGVDVTVIFKGLRGNKGNPGIHGRDGTDGGKGRTGDRVDIYRSFSK